MNILIIGSGGREHAIAWKVAQSPKLTKLYVMPGNPGTAQVAENVGDISVDDHSAVVRFCKGKKVDIVIVGPETPLANGLGDSLRAAGLRVFGPNKNAAEIESSKVFAKEFMTRHHIPTARFATFVDFDAAINHVKANDYPIVIKASGLAAGKGVLLPETVAEAESILRQIMVAKEFGAAGDAVVIEERMSGPEVSLLAFSDGVTVKPLVPSQDHKRVFDGDQGPNTGGMGAYAPLPVCPPSMLDEIMRTIMQPAVDGLRVEGRLFVGLLYGGLMLTKNGPSVIEFNCRFGDPETQVVMPMLDTDLLEIVEACVEGSLADVEVRLKSGAAACVVLASHGYPGKFVYGLPITGLGEETANTVIFHSGTKIVDGQVVTAGGRVICVTGHGENIHAALNATYERASLVKFEGKHFRTDIGWQVVIKE